MKLAIMQPYLFPYLGYYQLVSAVDTFVFFDDVNYINKGWINRNQLLNQNQPIKFTVPLVKASQNKLIREIELADFCKWKKEFLKSVEVNYKKAPQFVSVFNWLNDFFLKEYVLISDLAAESVRAVAQLLQLPAIFKNSSSVHYREGNEQNGSDKILEICKILGATTYINPKNGTSLYNSQQFQSVQIRLHFITMQEINYPQLRHNSFVPNLSMIDVLMFNDITETQNLLGKYSLN